MDPKKFYLGDGVYVTYDGYSLVLTTENGERVTNTIFVEPEVYAALVEFVRRASIHHDHPFVRRLVRYDHR